MRFPAREVTEGATRLLVPDVSRPEDGPAFYNPHMALNRDVTVAVVKALESPKRVCDCLAGTGAKGVRIASETGAQSVLLNDLNPNAVHFINENVRFNSLSNVDVSSKDANVLLSENKRSFEFIDVDPFGSPAPFIDSACRALLPKNGVLAVTATDTGALCGSFPSAAMRRYGARVRRTSFQNELGLRVLVGFCVRTAAKYDYGLKPILCHATRHYFRVFLRSERGKAAADKAMNNLGFLNYCYSCGNRLYCIDGKCCGRDMEWLGLMWTRGLYDKDFLSQLQEGGSPSLLSAIRSEFDASLPSYDLHVTAKKLGKAIPRFDKAIEALEGAGFRASRTHLNPHALRSDASFDELRSLIFR
ncbi:MAG: tRNA (guanine(10)-N(2))-dimethyltransferase [Candidatus Diapherotrites archaeon]|nr:tRNA (guanine(10)-N(2))-dimethyltransferase [Candidatus Diapherotrites archaeon]